MRDIWGSSPTDVYAVGDGGINAGNMWHFDGTVWSPINLPFGSFALWKIHGFSLNNIYAAGVRFYQTGWDSSGNPVVSDSSLLIHFDGTQWSEVKHNPRSAFLLGLWGNSPLDIWAGGLGALYHYNSTGWNRLSYPSDFAIQDITGFSSKDVYFLSYYYPSSAYFYSVLEHYDGRTITRIDSTDELVNKFGISSILAIPPDILYSVGFGIFKYQSGSWNKVFDVGNIISGICASSSDNIFAVGQGIVLNYNGKDWYRYNQFTDQNVIYYRAWTNGEEVFIEGPTLTYPMKTIILHGK